MALRDFLPPFLAYIAGGVDSAGNPTAGVPVVGYSTIVGGTVTRPADTTAYASGDLIANSTTALSVTPITIAAGRAIDTGGLIRKVRLSTALAWAGFTVRVHFFKNSPVVATVGDNGVFATNVAGIAAIHLGYCDVTFDQSFSDGCKGEGIPNVGSEIIFDPSSGTQNVYALLEARGAYTPASGQVFTLAVEVLQN